MILSTTEKKEELKLAETLSKKTHFSPHVNFLTIKRGNACLIRTFQEVERLFDVYWTYGGSRANNFNRKIFRVFLFECFNMTEELFLDRIFKMFNPDMDTTITR